MSEIVEFRDPASLPEASYWKHPVDDLEPQRTALSEINDKYAGIIRYLVSRIIESTDPVLEAKIIGLAFGMVFVGNSEAEVAADHKLTRQAVSKRVLMFQTLHEVNGSIHNKRSLSREKYRSRNSRRTKIK